MRVSTASFYRLGLGAMSGQQSSLLDVQQRIGTGRAYLRPSDNPVAATQALTISQSKSLNQQFGASREQANIRLGMEENAMRSITTTIQNIQTLLVNAGNGTLSDADRATLATDLQANYDQLVGLANSDDGNGQFLFAGLRSGTAPFIKSATGDIAYNGDFGEQLLQVDVARQMSSSDNGYSIFMSVQGTADYIVSAGAGNTGTAKFGALSVTDASNALHGHDLAVSFAVDATTGATTYDIMDNSAVPPVAVVTGAAYTEGAAIEVGGVSVTVSGKPADGDTMTFTPAEDAGTDVFSNIQDVINALRQPAATPAERAALDNSLSTGIRKMSNTLDNVLTVRASVGSRMKELDTLDSIGDNRELNYETTLSSLRDLDYAAAFTEYYQLSMALQAAQQSFTQIQGMTLLKFI